MATTIGVVGLTGCSYELAYDLLSQDVSSNSSTVRLYGILHVSNNYVSWSRGSASVHTSGLQAIGTYYSRGDHVVISRDFTFGHDGNGNFSAYIGASLSTTFVSGSCGGTLTLPQIQRIAITNSVNGSNIEGNFSVNYTKYVDSYSYKLRISIPYVVELEKIDYNNSGQTFTLSQQSINILFNEYQTTNTFNLGFAIETWSGGTLLSSGNEIIITCKIENANPIFSDFEFEDINNRTLALTGNNKVNVNGYSIIRATISTTNKAESQKGATMNKYRFIIGESSSEKTYSDDSNVLITINNASSGTYNMYAIDSRNNSTLVTKLAEQEINYVPVYIDKQTTKIERNNNQVGGSAILTLNGTFWNDDFGQVTNDIVISYQFKKSNSNTWINGTTTITPTITDKQFTFSGQIASDNQDTTWDLDTSYNVKIIVEDKLSITEYEMILNSDIPTMSIDKDGVGIMCAYDSSKGGNLQVNGVPVGSDVYSTNEIKTNKTWIDNKPIYRKVVYINSLPNNTQVEYSSGINETLDHVFIKEDNSYYTWTNDNDYSLRQNITVIYYKKTTNKIVLATNTNLSGWYMYLTLEYTKAAD